MSSLYVWFNSASSKINSGHLQEKCFFQLRPFKIISAKNTKTNAKLSERDAMAQGVIDDHKVTFTDIKNSKQVLIADAIQVRICDFYAY